MRAAAGVALLVLLASACGRAAPEPPPSPIAGSAVPATRPAAVTPPPVGAGFDYQLGGAYPPAVAVGVVERDRTEAPVAGVYGICYVNAFQTQPDELEGWRRDHRDLLLTDADGREVEDPGYPGEVLLNISTATRRSALADFVGDAFDGCARRGYRAVEPDNLDSWIRSQGRLTPENAVAMARLLTARAHAAGLAVAQKNAAELAPQGPAIGFDFAVAEECAAFGECTDYSAVYGEHVFEVEYTDNGRAAFAAACRTPHGRRTILLRDRALVPAGQPGYAYAAC